MGKVDDETDDLHRGYDATTLTGGVRGKYFERYRAGTNIVLLSPEVARAFPDDKSVNEALRSLIKVAETKAPRGRSQKRNRA